MRYVLESARGRKQGLRIPIRQKVFVIGSSRSSQIRSVQDGVGRKHCALIVHKRKLYIQDLESGHPTFVNGLRLFPGGRRKLRAGDRVALGPMAFVVRAQRKKRKLLAPVAAPYTAPPRPSESALPVPMPTPLPSIAPAAPGRPPPLRTVGRMLQKTVALVVLTFICMGIGWLLFQGPLAPAEGEKDSEEGKVTRAPTKDGEPEHSSAGAIAGKQPEASAKVPERKLPENKKLADESKPLPPNPADDTRVRLT